jgi:hypothetical protein
MAMARDAIVIAQEPVDSLHAVKADSWPVAELFGLVDNLL